MTCLYYKYPPCWAVKSLFRLSAGSDSYLGQSVDVTWPKSLHFLWTRLLKRRVFLNKEKDLLNFLELKMSQTCYFQHLAYQHTLAGSSPSQDWQIKVSTHGHFQSAQSKQACCPLQWIKLQSLNAHQCKCVFLPDIGHSDRRAVVRSLWGTNLLPSYLFLARSWLISDVCSSSSFSSLLVDREFSRSWISIRDVWFSTWRQTQR